MLPFLVGVFDFLAGSSINGANLFTARKPTIVIILWYFSVAVQAQCLLHDATLHLQEAECISTNCHSYQSGCQGGENSFFAEINAAESLGLMSRLDSNLSAVGQWINVKAPQPSANKMHPVSFNILSSFSSFGLSGCGRCKFTGNRAIFCPLHDLPTSRTANAETPTACRCPIIFCASQPIE